MLHEKEKKKQKKKLKNLGEPAAFALERKTCRSWCGDGGSSTGKRVWKK
jgi:hypothetical protein